METVRKNRKETLEIEATNGNEECLRWADQMDAAEERVPELEGRTIRTSQPENQRGKKAEQAPRDTYGRCSVLMPGAPKGEKERNEVTFASLITEFPHNEYQTPNHKPRKLGAGKYRKTTARLIRRITFKLLKSQDKEKKSRKKLEERKCYL